MAINSFGQMIRPGRMLLYLTGFFLVLASVNAISAPLDCSNVSRVISDVDISYSEGDAYKRYQVSYDKEGYHWLGTVYEFLPPFSDNALLKDVDVDSDGEITTDIASKYKALILDSGVHQKLGKSRQFRIKQGLAVTFEAVDEYLPFGYGLYGRRSGENIHVFRISGIAADSGPAPSGKRIVETVKNLIKSCGSYEA